MIVLIGYLHRNPSDVSDFTANVPAITSSTSAEKGFMESITP
ncbi:hypothetical protein ACE3NQ_12600 [Paenibacillus terreus]|uniref:Uncharacterized protein n=1 Tax=Paenibacillus terreus TaxID=1387834 RepID=A0ABV5B7T4_9BACL